MGGLIDKLVAMKIQASKVVERLNSAFMSQTDEGSVFYPLRRKSAHSLQFVVNRCSKQSPLGQTTNAMLWTLVVKMFYCRSKDEWLTITKSSKISLTQTNQEKNNMELPYDLPKGRMASPKQMNGLEKFQTAFDPPSFSGNHVAIYFL